MEKIDHFEEESLSKLDGQTIISCTCLTCGNKITNLLADIPIECICGKYYVFDGDSIHVFDDEIRANRFAEGSHY